jgi:hypothetical protein
MRLEVKDGRLGECIGVSALQRQLTYGPANSGTVAKEAQVVDVLALVWLAALRQSTSVMRIEMSFERTCVFHR